MSDSAPAKEYERAEVPDPSTVPRVMGRFGFSGSKTGPSPQCARLYDEEDVQQVEALMRKYKRKRKKAK